MGRFGFIHEKLDIKILILFILARLPEPVDSQALAELVLCDDGIGYFDYTECLSELVDTLHVEERDGRFQITEKGLRNGGAIESSIPYSVREKAQRTLTPVASALKRNSMINASHEEQGGSGCMVSLSMSDGVGEVIYMRLLTSGVEQAELIEKNFRSGAEDIYNKIIAILSE